MRIKFEKGKQREFLDKILKVLACPSLRELQNRISGISYSSLKNYFSERRTLTENLFLDLCNLSNLNKEEFIFDLVNNFWGQSKGGRISKRS